MLQERTGLAARCSHIPVVTLSYGRLSELVGAPVDTIRDRLPFLGLDIEHQDGDAVSVEYSPNRFDYSTEFGIALGLQGILDIHTGMVKMEIEPAQYNMRVHDSVSSVRPSITGILAKGHTLDDYTIRHLIYMQEDLHHGPGRRRQRVAIGIHDADKIQFPLLYTTVGRDFEFAPLGSTDAMPIHDIMAKTEQGMQYGHLAQNHHSMPIILDKNCTTASMPPIINSSHTEVTSSTRNLFVDVTGFNQADVEGVLSIIAVTLQTAGYTLEHVDISGGTNRTPPLAPRRISFDHTMSNRILGLDMSMEETTQCIKRARLGAVADYNKIMCIVPPYRMDILGVMDIVEEVALGYGIDKIIPTMPGIGAAGGTDITTALGSTMTGLGYTQVMNSCLSSDTILSQGGSAPKILVANPKSQSHTVLRGALLPGLMENLSHNIHEPYPHRLYEYGVVFDMEGGAITEHTHLACVTAYKDSTYSEAKSILLAVLYSNMGIKIKTPPYNVAPYEMGQSARIMSGTQQIGHIGVISRKCRQAFKIRDDIVVSGWEVELIFDNKDSLTAS
ncbi:MAG: phenylalanine--tRNA ligase subunit beta [Cenarchaeum sp. SB0665_bin_23]|nr:phenylalanine--tRNA ligase subunit beta [Cenarchaeum sp. SB0665_bin_23]MYG32942.1 phenylalanine--tRNA ligase subunit beta [Cenarchaeum sp. SB0677_bin_16]